MATITISVDDDVESLFRKVAGKASGERKGYLGDAITEAMRHWLASKKEREIQERQLKLLIHGFKMGKLQYKTRDELHVR